MSMPQTPAKIYLAGERGFLENEVHRRYSTFSFAEYVNEHKQPFGKLHTFNDEILPAGSTLQQTATVNGYLLLIPVTGAINYRQQGQSHDLDAGQVLLVPVSRGIAFELTNPFATDWVNFLHIEIKADDVPAGELKIVDFDFEHTVNQMMAVIPQNGQQPFSLHIGRFGGQEEMLHPVAEGNSLFAFSIGGAFELQNRLLHERDGLALWNTPGVDAEALSNGAVLLLLELNS